MCGPGGSHEPVEIDEALLGLIAQCGELYRATGGAFDITSTPLSRCWGFLHREGRVPSSDAIEAARASVGFGAVDLDAPDGRCGSAGRASS